MRPSVRFICVCSLLCSGACAWLAPRVARAADGVPVASFDEPDQPAPDAAAGASDPGLEAAPATTTPKEPVPVPAPVAAAPTRPEVAQPQAAPPTETPDQPHSISVASMQPQAFERGTPGYIKFMRWGGLGLAGLGGLLIVVSYDEYDAASMNEKAYRDARTQNDLGWAMVAIGAASFALSFPLNPDPHVDPDEAESTSSERPRSTAAITADGRGTLNLRLAF